MYQHHIFEMAKTIAKNLQTAYGLPVEAAMIIVKAEDHFVQVSGTLLDAIEAARALAARCRAEADVISVADDLVGELNAWRYGHNLLTIHPEE